MSAGPASVACVIAAWPELETLDERLQRLAGLAFRLPWPLPRIRCELTCSELVRSVDTLLVRIPGASHDIGARPSLLIAKAACVLAWFEKYRKKP